MKVGSWAPVLAAIIAGLVAVLGYLVTQFVNRRDRKAKSFAEALAAVREYQELPYLVRRRAASDGATRAAHAQRWSEVMAKLGFYVAWLRIDSPTAGLAYADLVTQTRRQCRGHLADAWAGTVIESDADMIGPKALFRWDNGAELDLCVFAMRRELRFLRSLLSRSTQRLLDQQRQIRAGQRTDELNRPPSDP
jgi:hypothetical protein